MSSRRSRRKRGRAQDEREGGSSGDESSSESSSSESVHRVKRRRRGSASRRSRQPSPSNASSSSESSSDDVEIKKNTQILKPTESKVSEEYRQYDPAIVIPRILKERGRDTNYRIYADGVFDLFHVGHAKALEQCKRLFPNCTLVVGVCSDKDTHSKKGKTVMSEAERGEAVKHCKWADEVVIGCPWIMDMEFIKKHKIDFVCHDPEPYPDHIAGIADVYGFLKEADMFIATTRTDGISTSDLITRIVSSYEAYLKRNIQRGYSREQLGISFVKEQRVKMDMRVSEVKAKVVKMNTEIKRDLQTNVNEWSGRVHKAVQETKSRVEDFVRKFISNVDTNVKRVKKYYKKQKGKLSKLVKSP